MTVHDRSTDRTVVDVLPATAPVPMPGAGFPPEWTPPPAPPTGEAPAQPAGPGRHRTKLAVAGVVVAAVAATAGITAAVVGSDDSAGAAATDGPAGRTGQDFGGGRGFGGGRDGGPGGGGGTAAALHGTYVVSDGNGGYVTQETQTGTVSAVGTTSITVKSADGYSKTYVIGGSTTVDNGADQIADVRTGHTVRVVATVSGDTATATAVTDTDLAAANLRGGLDGGLPDGGPAQGGDQQQGTQPGAPAQNGTATGT